MTRTVSIAPPILYVGTPVVLISTLNPDGTANLAPNSSVFALGDRLTLGVGMGWRTFENLEREREAVLNFPDARLWPQVERLAGLTGQDHPPAHAPSFECVKDKFGRAGLTPIPSETVGPPRVDECPIQAEVEVLAIHPAAPGEDVAYVETCWRRVHVHERLSVAGTQRIHPARWDPLFYIFRHYAAADRRLGMTFRAEDRELTEDAA
ncbi:MAG: flavin reductase family protein [Proteobacteria bacterium]|nr:flavin reductase family protein [Pseudomonadota bacterium]